MFENVLGQAATAQLIQDIDTGVLASAMLFHGNPASGKGTTALELGRFISCEGLTGRAAWNCGCTACCRHRLLIHPDLLCLGSKPFSAEIAASAGAFLREVTQESAASRSNAYSPGLRAEKKNLMSAVVPGVNRLPCGVLLIRSVRKLLARFNPVLWEDEPKKGKVAIAPLVNSLEEDLDELELFISAGSAESTNHLAKLTEGMLKNAFKLESEGIGETIPIAQIRKAAWWSRLAPAGRGKLLVIENADRMQEEARNSLLKILEEPPARVTMVLTTVQSRNLLPTILSRLRPYRFSSRDAAVEGEVIRRVFKDQTLAGSDQTGETGLSIRGISAYLDSFLPVSAATLHALAAFFAASAAYKAALLSKKQGRPISDEVLLLGKYTAPRAEAAGLGRPQGEASALVNLILERAEKFEVRSLFSRFLCCLLELVSLSRRNAGEAGVSSLPSTFCPQVAYNEIWTKCSAWAESAVCTYRLSPAQVLQKLFTDLSRGMAEI